MHRKTIVLFALGGLLGIAMARVLRWLMKARGQTVSPLTPHDLDADVGL